MATLTIDIPDEVVARENLSDATIRIELACRLFDAQKLSKAEACRLAGMDRMDFEEALIARGLPVLRYNAEMFAQDLAAVEKMRQQDLKAGVPS